METIVGMGWAGWGYPVCLLIGIFIGRYIWPRAKKTIMKDANLNALINKLNAKVEQLQPVVIKEVQDKIAEVIAFAEKAVKR